MKRATHVVCMAFLAVSCSREALPPDLSSTANACLYVTGIDGAHYSVAYASYQCSRSGYQPLPQSQFDSVEAWAYNAESAGFVSPLDYYRLTARLATQDSRSAHGFSPHSGFWAEYQWAEQTEKAYVTALDALGREDSIVVAYFERPLLHLHFAKPATLFLDMDHRHLSSRERADLFTMLVRGEAALQRERRMHTVRRTLEEAVRAVPGHEDARRRTFSVFRFDP